MKFHNKRVRIIKTHNQELDNLTGLTGILIPSEHGLNLVVDQPIPKRIVEADILEENEAVGIFGEYVLPGESHPSQAGTEQFLETHVEIIDSSVTPHDGFDHNWVYIYPEENTEQLLMGFFDIIGNSVRDNISKSR